MKIVTSLSVLVEPFLPFTATKIKKMVNFIPQQWDEISAPDVAPAIGETEILFQKIDDKVVDIQVSKLKKREISIEEFNKVVLKTAKILKAEMVEGSDNLIKCTVEIADKQRQIVAGVGKAYKPEELIGKTIIVVENLKPVKVRGVLSNGMFLAADTKEGIVLLTTDKPVASGEIVR